MASFLDTVIAKGAIHLWRLDELAGPTAVDAIGTADAPYFPEAVFGRPSPVETDPSSKAVGKRVALATTSAPAANWSYGGFVFTDPDQDAAILCRNGQLGLGGGNYIVWDHGQGRIRFNVANSDADILLDFIALPSTWYWVIGTRNGTAVFLYVNDALADQSVLFSSAPMDGAWVTTGSWKLGATGDSGNLGNLGDAIDEPCVFPSPLTLADSTEIYESALNSLSLTGYSNVISSAILYSDIEPDPISFPFRHNWADDWIERLSFATGVSTAIKGYESGNAQRIKPRREIEFTQVTKNDTERRMLRAKLNAHQNRKWLIPMLDDRERLTTPIASGATTIPTDTLYKDYEIGGRVGLRQLNDAGEIIAWEELIVGAMTDEDLTTSTPTVNDYDSPEVYPIRRAILEASIQPRGHTDSVEEVTILAKLIAEDEQPTPHRIVEWTPATTYKTYEVFPFAQWPNNWSELRDYAIDRLREDVDYEAGSFVTESDTNAASEAFSWRILLDTKQKQAEFLGWFYARAGSLNYLWVPTMQRDFEVVSAASDDLTVKGHNYSENFSGSEFRRDLAFIYNDNSTILRRIEGVSLSGVNEILDLDNSVPTLTNLRSASYLLFCRLDNDTIERAAVTDTKARFAWLFRELLSSPE